MADIIQVRRGTAAEWVTANPILASGEFGMEQDTIRLKLGNAVDAWNDLPYLLEPVGGIKVEYEGDGYYDVPDNTLLTELVVNPGSDANIRIGSTPGGDEYFFETPVTTDGAVFELNLFAKVEKRVYIYGMPADSSVVFFTKFVRP